MFSQILPPCPRLAAGMHVFDGAKQDVDGRDFVAKTCFALRPGHDASVQSERLDCKNRTYSERWMVSTR
jgi:hypothetical protein